MLACPAGLAACLLTARAPCRRRRQVMDVQEDNKRLQASVAELEGLQAENARLQALRRQAGELRQQNQELAGAQQELEQQRAEQGRLTKVGLPGLRRACSFLAPLQAGIARAPHRCRRRCARGRCRRLPRRWSSSGRRWGSCPAAARWRASTSSCSCTASSCTRWRRRRASSRRRTASWRSARRGCPTSSATTSSCGRWWRGWVACAAATLGCLRGPSVAGCSPAASQRRPAWPQAEAEQQELAQLKAEHGRLLQQKNEVRLGSSSSSCCSAACTPCQLALRSRCLARQQLTRGCSCPPA